MLLWGGWKRELDREWSCVRLPSSLKGRGETSRKDPSSTMGRGVRFGTPFLLLAYHRSLLRSLRIIAIAQGK